MNALPGLILLFLFTTPALCFFLACRLIFGQHNREEPTNHLLARLGLVLICFSWSFTALAQNRPPARDQILAGARKAEEEGRLADAVKILGDAVHSMEQAEPENPRLAIYLRFLASIYDLKHDYADALAVAQRALAVDQKAFGPSGSLALGDFGNIAGILRDQGKNVEAEQVLEQAIELLDQSPKPDPDRMVQLYGNLASLYVFEHRWAEAESLLESAMKACKQLPPVRSECRGIRGMLASVYRSEGRLVDREQPAPSHMPLELARLEKTAQQYMNDALYLQAEIAYKQVIAWVEQNPSTETTTPIHIVHDWTRLLPGTYYLLGQALEKQGIIAEAEASYKKGLELQESNASPKVPSTVGSFNFNGLLNLYRSQGRLAEMEPIIQQALELQERLLGENSNGVAETLLDLADVLREEGKTNQNKYREAVPFYERALKIQETNLGMDHPQLFRALTGYVSVLHSLHDETRGAQLQMRVDTIRQKSEAQNRRN
jgi:tetratricopeptide (TPR) repeat protein